MRLNKKERDEIHWMISQELPALQRYSHILLPPTEHDKCDDLVQDTLERAIKKSHTWRREGTIRSWLYRIQYTVFLNRYRRGSYLKEIAKEPEAMEYHAGSTTGAAQEKELEYKRVLQAANKLKPPHREVLLLVAVEGLPYDQVAHVMDIPVGTVRSRLARAREELRDIMKAKNKAGHAASSAPHKRKDKRIIQ